MSYRVHYRSIGDCIHGYGCGNATSCSMSTECDDFEPSADYKKYLDYEANYVEPWEEED